MKRRNFALSMFIIFGTIGSAFANPNEQMEKKLYEKNASEGKSYYQTLGDLFKNGTAPMIEKLIGVAWAGRCFHKTKPNIPRAGGYIFREAKHVGPIAREERSYEAAAYVSRDLLAIPNRLDTLSIDEIYAGYSRARVPLYFHPVINIESGILAKLRWGNNGFFGLKASGDYLISEVFVAKAEDLTGESNQVEGLTSLRCYYFIPEYN